MPRFPAAGFLFLGLVASGRLLALSDGNYDPTFPGAGHFTFHGDYSNDFGSDAWVVNVESDGNLFVAGNAFHIVTGGGNGFRWWLGELSPDGQFVPTFGAADGNGRISNCQLGYPCPGDDSLALETALAQPDGKYLAVLSDYSVVRTTIGAHALDSAGTASGTGIVYYGNLQIDDALGYIAKVKSIALQPDGKLLLAGVGAVSPKVPTPLFAVVRLNGDLSLDNAFAAYTSDGVIYSGGNVIAVDANDAAERASVVLVQPGGHIVLVGIGSHDAGGLNPHLELARVGADGLLDQTFGNGGTVVLTWLAGTLDINSSISAVLDSAGRIVVATNNASRSGAVVGRVTSTGQPDGDFGILGFEYIDKSLFVPTCDYVDTKAVTLDSAGRILVAGDCVVHNSATYYFSVFRLRTSPLVAIDPSFGASGFSYGGFDPTSQSDQCFGMALDGGGRPVLVGPSDPIPPGNAAGIARLTYDLVYTNGLDGAPRGCLPPNCN